MKVYRFKSTVTQTSLAISTAIGVVISFFIFNNTDIYISKEAAYLVVSLLSLASVWLSIKRAGKEFEEVLIFDNEEVKLFFHNKMKTPITLSKRQIDLIVSEDKVEFFRRNENIFVGRAIKTALEGGYDWSDFLASIGEKPGIS